MNTDSMSKVEEEGLAKLAKAYKRLHAEDGRLDMKSELGHRAVTTLLDKLESAAIAMNGASAPRNYRSAFTVNYRALFPDETRSYRVDVLEASADQFAVIWVNGDKFEFSADAMRKAEVLQGSWTDLLAMLERWSTGSQKPVRTEIIKTLVALDQAWATFENTYISELMDIEHKARSLIVKAIEHERALEELEKIHGKSEAVFRLPAYREEQGLFVRCVSKLNSVANVKRKGRDDLGADIYFDALATIRRCDKVEHSGQNANKMSAARILATDVVESFNAMRKYFREVSNCLERVDPHLCNNAGLVARLVDWEESWEVGARYVQREKLLDAICDVVSAIRSAQVLVPSLSSMCEDCDAELFLVLPRFIWLRFLEGPEMQVELLKTMLPHRFADVASGGAYDDDCVVFQRNYEKLKGMLPGSLSNAIIKRVVLGTGQSEKDETYHCIDPAIRDAVYPHMEDLMREMESFSIELQRHCPEDWNQCSAILIQCLTSEQGKENGESFGV